MKNALFLFLLFIGTGIAFADVPTQEKEALKSLYQNTNGEHWINSWDLNTPVASWYGITVKNNSVIAINLLFNNLEGTLSSSLAGLQNLERLELSFNKLHGEIPATIGDLKKLKVFAVNGNNLTGGIPNSFGDLLNITEIHLSSNLLQGKIPSSIGKLKQLEVLNLFDNNLSGILPYELNQNKQLKQLVIAKNNILASYVFNDLVAFKSEDQNFKNIEGLTPGKTIIATQTNDDDN
ncbi:MAG: Two component regulator three Y domain protein [Bacteroidetes bacterium]|jgi:Leucine-rich repeat (LRR) protein|nr:Two component regulator three Y domain protein [Bacteroidota bacterium]